jgi:hypothetical protein
VPPQKHGSDLKLRYHLCSSCDFASDITFNVKQILQRKLKWQQYLCAECKVKYKLWWWCCNKWFDRTDEHCVRVFLRIG